jgi:large subunit ribosomal protein L25
MNSVAISSKERSEVGTKYSNLYRKAGSIPAVIYGSGDPQHILVDLSEVRHLIYTPEFKLAEITVGGGKIKTLVKDVQYHPTSDEILHIDFLTITEGTPVKVEVPVKFTGTSPGVKAGGKLIQQIRKLKIKTTPDKLIDEITVDISHLELGQVLRVKSVPMTEGIEILVNSATPIAYIEIPRALKSAAAADAKAKAGGKKK